MNFSWVSCKFYCPQQKHESPHTSIYILDVMGELSCKLHKNENNTCISLYQIFVSKLYGNILKYYKSNFYMQSLDTRRRVFQQLLSQSWEALPPLGTWCSPLCCEIIMEPWYGLGVWFSLWIRICPQVNAKTLWNLCTETPCVNAMQYNILFQNFWRNELCHTAVFLTQNDSGLLYSWQSLKQIKCIAWN